MKHVRELAAEPPLLARYRSEHPAEERRPANEATSVWNEFRSDQPAYRELLEKLAAAQQGLCIYCEQRLVDGKGTLVFNDYQAEHVKAKSGADGRVLDWENLALACGGGTYPHHQDATRAFTGSKDTSCGQAKGDYDLPRGCDPRRLPLVEALIEVDLDGKLSVNSLHCSKAGFSDECRGCNQAAQSQLRAPAQGSAGPPRQREQMVRALARRATEEHALPASAAATKTRTTYCYAPSAG